jgi:large subunit GTPase 1
MGKHRSNNASKGEKVMSKLTKQVQNKTHKGVHPNAISKYVAYVEDDTVNKNLKSNLEAKNLDEFLDLAKLSHKNYEVLNEQVVAQTLNTGAIREIHQNQFTGNFLKNALKNADIKLYETKPLAIPKRPKWKQGISALEFERMERESFLNWRRALAKEEESNLNYAITPFEKNIEVWRQLWLTVEKCHLLIQIVDGRNPLYFRCPDLERYIEDIDKNKEYLLLINKADLMSNKVRKSWADYFKEKGINYLFFSALEEGKKIDEELEKENNANVEESSSEEEDDESDEEDNTQGNMFNKFKNLKVEDDDEEKKPELSNTKVEEQKEYVKLAEETNVQIEREDEIKESENDKEEIPTTTETVDPLDSDESIKIYNRTQLIELVKSIVSTKKKDHAKDCYYTGFIGYPNVGKSSVINVLMMKKKVAVANMPGKTRHYQTLFLPDDKQLCLMDCPGLVFPSFTSSKGDMAVNGIMQIDTLREWHTPIAVIIQKIPRKILEIYYKIQLPDIYSATQFLQILAAKRGYITGRSLPDEAKTAKLILKEYVAGKLLYCNLRPDYDEKKHGMIIPYQEDLANEAEKENIITQEEKEKMELIKEIPADFDDDFEKINIDVDTTRTLKTNKENFDSMYFNHIMSVEDTKDAGKDKKITKDMKRALKFAVKRGEITEDEYEEAFTVHDFETIMERLKKEAAANKKDLVGVKIIDV